MVKLRKGPALNIHGTLQNAIIATINDPTYSFSLPKLADWESIVSSSPDEKQRLEFVGDAVMHLSVALYLYRLFPNAAPGLYTKIRSAVNTNATFTHLMVKAGAYELPSQSRNTKVAADSFEVIVAALYMERGFTDVCAWVQEQYAPLIAAARQSYDKCLRKSDRNTPFLSSKRYRAALDPAGTPLLKKIRLSSGRDSPRRTLMAQRVIDRMKSKGKVKLCFPSRKSKPPLWTCHSPELACAPKPRRPPVVIDLTVNSGLSDDEESPPNSPRISKPGIKSSNMPETHPPSESDTSLRSDRSSCDYTSIHWSPKQASATPSQPTSSVSSSPVGAMPPGHITHIVGRFEQPGRSSSQVDNIHADYSHSGTYENPIMIEDSESED